MPWFVAHSWVSSRLTRICACVGESMDQRTSVKSLAWYSRSGPVGPRVHRTTSGFLSSNPFGGCILATATPLEFVPLATPKATWDTESYEIGQDAMPQFRLPAGTDAAVWKPTSPLEPT